MAEGSSFTESGSIGGSAWSVTRSGEDWGGRIDGGVLELSNTASGAANASGWVFAGVSTSGFGGPFQSKLQNNSGVVTWKFNMRQIRSNPAGFSAGNYGAAFILGSTSSDVAATGSGYALVLGNTGTPDSLRLINFSGGIQSLGGSSSGLIVAGSPLDDPTNDFMSISLSYDPSDNTWNLFGRNDGGTSFTDPASGTLTSLGSVVNSEYTGIDLNYMGAYWQGATALDQTATFDNISVSVIPEPSTYASIIGLIFMIVVLLRKKGKKVE